jgi:hypothetical protein
MPQVPVARLFDVGNREMQVIEWLGELRLGRCADEKKKRTSDGARKAVSRQ